jgi:predicted Zn finger-like uncharacterized protein
MDVRCDRCETEYELEDGSVTEAETPVQCTSCGHTFLVTPEGLTVGSLSPTGTPAPALATAEPTAADWLLATDDGKTHRFRDLTTLQKWIVERKVTADDRVSQKAGPWMRLGELGELQPFFDVVAQADRASAAAGTPGRRGGVGPGGLDARAASAAASSDDDIVDDDIYTSGKHSRPAPAQRPVFDGIIPPEEDYEPLSFAPSHRGAKILAGVFIAGLAVVAAYAGFKRPHWLPFFSSPEPVAVTPAPPEPAARPVPPPSAPPPAAMAGHAPAQSPSAAVPVATADGASSAAAPATAASDTDGRPSAVAAGGEPPAGPAPVPAEPGKDTAAPARANPADAAAGSKGKSYERLVSDADRLLENGQTTKAQKLYDEALQMQPNGVAALTGSGFLQLDRQKPLAAISLFKRAIARAPGYPPALFGMGEAYRAQGYTVLAIDYYKQYLATAPGGPDAHAARGQLKELEDAPQRRIDAPSPSAVIPPSDNSRPERRIEPPAATSP